MNTKQLERIFARTMYCMVIAAMVFSVTGTAYAAGFRTFVGVWRAIDNFDGSLMRVLITGPAGGPFRITWTESYFSFCDGRVGLAVGKGYLSPDDPHVLEADMRLKCLRTGDTMEWHQVWHYKPDYDVLASYGDYGVETIWTRLGHALVPRMDLRVNYGHDWVESFYEGGHTVWLTVTDGEGNVKATAEVVTGPDGYFQTPLELWIPSQPDIQPLDWVDAQVDNGQTAQVQIGDISGMIDLEDDAVEGTLYAPWFPDEVDVECHSWGAPLPEEILKYDVTLPNGEDTYSCSWMGEWDIQPYQDVGVGYSGPDAHWVANAFIAPNPRIVASEAGDWFWTTEFYPGMLDLFIYESVDEGAALLWSGQQEADQWGFMIIGYDVHGQNLMEGNYLVVSDGVNQKGLVMQPISVTVFDTENEIMAGFAPAGSEVWAAAGPQDWQERIMVTADLLTGEWQADFTTIGFDITEEMRPWSYAHIYDGDGDANEGNTPLPGATLIVIANQPDWVDSGITISAGQSFTIEAFGLMNPCSDTYPNGADYCIFYTPLGAEGVVPYENEFGIFPGPGLRFMGLLGRIGDGAPFYIGESGTFTAEQVGTLWLTPNDNLRTDNQGAYSVLVWLEP